MGPATDLTMMHWSYCIFFAVYVLCVGFAVICIIEAIFLKDTLKMAAKDADAMVQEHLDSKRETFKRIHDLFIAADQSGDGLISIEEFEDILSIPKVRGFLDMLELQIEEVVALFNLLDPGSGEIPYDDFVQGIFKLKGQARSMDVISVSLDCQKHWLLRGYRTDPRHVQVNPDAVR